uniref:Uncharacterized protein n=1 Tax=Candidatus Kentrum sp. DK TaxID=2126562 RepID=A0A450T317_9GAMM|nr:MAG: hypothetical protein BECKDK2373C_GA0170839_108518 [Candidatus Kentron sp. DK]
MEIQTINIIVAVTIAIIGTAAGGAILHLYTPWLDKAKRSFPRKPKEIIKFSGKGKDLINFDRDERVEDESVLWGYEAINGKFLRFSKRVSFDADLRMLHDGKDSAATSGKITGSGPLHGDTAHITYSIEIEGGYWSGFMILEIRPAAKNMSGYWIVSSPVKADRIAFGDVVFERQS